MNEILDKEAFLLEYKRLKNRIYTIREENARDELFFWLKETRKLYTESRGKASLYLDNVDIKVKETFKNIEDLIASYPIHH